MLTLAVTALQLPVPADPLLNKKSCRILNLGRGLRLTKEQGERKASGAVDKNKIPVSAGPARIFAICNSAVQSTSGVSTEGNRWILGFANFTAGIASRISAARATALFAGRLGTATPTFSSKI